MNLELKLKTLRAEVETLRLKGVDLTPADVERVPLLNKEIADTQAALKARRDAEAAIKAFGSSAPGQAPASEDGRTLVTSRSTKAAGFVSAFHARRAEQPASNKSIFPSGGIDFTYSGAIVEDPKAVFSLVGLMARRIVSAPTGSYLRQTVRDLTIGFVAPGTRKPESKLGFEPQKWRLTVIAHVLAPMDKYALGDFDGTGTFIHSQMAFGLDAGINQLILNGATPSTAGAEDETDGLLTVEGMPTQPFKQSKLRSIRAAIGDLESSGVTVTGIALSALDWEDLETEEDNTGRTKLAADGRSAARTLYGVPVTVVTGMPEGTALVGDWSTVELLQDGGYAIEVFNTGTADIDGFPNPVDLVTHNLVRVRAETRAAVVIRDASSFRKVRLTATAPASISSVTETPSPEDSTSAQADAEDPALPVA